jgi:hypothetical protein
MDVGFDFVWRRVCARRWWRVGRGQRGGTGWYRHGNPKHKRRDTHAVWRVWCKHDGDNVRPGQKNVQKKQKKGAMGSPASGGEMKKAYDSVPPTKAYGHRGARSEGCGANKSRPGRPWVLRIHRSSRTSVRRSTLNQKLLELARINRLGHMGVKARLEGGLPIRVIGITGNRHKGRLGKALQLAECPD